jgi:hypothetical protein
MELKRKLYARGSSFETTIPRPMLFPLDMSKKYCVVYHFDPAGNSWHISFEEIKKEVVSKNKKVKKWRKSSGSS